LRLFGNSHQTAARLTEQAIERVNLADACLCCTRQSSDALRQRIKLAQAMCHKPTVLVLDEPLNGLDPLIRAETIALFRSLAQEGLYVIISSHVLHEVDALSDQVVLLSNGYVVAEGQIHGVREEIHEHPMQILIRCNKPGDFASRVFQQDYVVEARILPDGLGLLVKTRDADRFYLLLNRIAQNGISIESVAPADDDVLSVYEYLIGAEESPK